MIEDIKQKKIFLMIASGLFAFFGGSFSSFSKEIEFDAGFLKAGSSSAADISRFNKPVGFLPGKHELNISVNNLSLGYQQVTILDKPSDQYCFTGEQVLSWKLKFQAIPNAEALKAAILDKNNKCIDIGTLIPEVKIQPKADILALNVVVPQAYQDDLPSGYIDPEFWNEGVPAAFLNYNYSASKSGGGVFGAGYGSFLGLNVGANWGAWRYRHAGYYSKQPGFSSHYAVGSNYLQRDLIGWKSKLTIGDYSNQGKVFDPVMFRGVQVNSDESMLPNSISGFVPAIIGVAETNAIINVYQAGRMVFQTQVPPGPFNIDDLKTAGYAGDLEVVVQESDGREKKFIVPFSNVAQLIRPGSYRYSVSAGRVRGLDNSYEPYFAEGTLEYGLSNFVTLYGGLTVAKKYTAGSIGAALNTRAGALAFDVTQSHASDLPFYWLNGAGTSQGQSYRLTYNKNFTETKTNLVLAAYRYSSKGFLSLEDYARAKGANNGPNYISASLVPQRNRFQVYLSQDFGSYGYVHLSGITEDYWFGREKSTTYTLGYTVPFQWGSAQIALDRFDNYTGDSEQRASILLNIPLEDHTISAGVSNRSRGNSFSLGVTGSLDEERQMTYGLSAEHSTGDFGSTYTGGNLRFSGAYGNVGVNLGKNSVGSTGYGFTAGGGVVLHEGGINFTKPTQETFAIIEAPEAAGAKINGNSQARIAANGYGISSALNSYRRNMIWLDSGDVASNVEVIGQGRDIAPTDGAIVRLKFETSVGDLSLIQISLENGGTPPIGAELRAESGSVISMVGQGGYVFARGLEGEQSLRVVWGNAEDEQCFFAYNSAEQGADVGQAFDQKTALCKLLK